MLHRLAIKGFKSFADAEIKFPRMTVLFGPNAAGKSNVLDAVLALSRIGTSRTLSDAIARPIRGYPIEAFAFPQGGLPALLSQETASFSLEADIGTLKNGSDRLRYRIVIQIHPGSGSLTVSDEYLAALSLAGEPKGRPPIECVDGQLHVRRKGKAAHPRQEPLGLNHTLLSDSRWIGDEYQAIQRARQELSLWRVYYLDPRHSMRLPRPPSDVGDIGESGRSIAPFLYRLRAEEPKLFSAVQRTLRSLIPAVEDLTIDLDKQRGTLDIRIRQGGIDFSSRIISEGTLRVLALCALVVNPWGGNLLAFEEPENGVHPRRIELIACLLTSLSEKRQVIVTTHSSLFCETVLRLAHKRPDEIAVLTVRRESEGTLVERLPAVDTVFQNAELRRALTAESEDGLFESIVLRGLLDE